MNYKRAVTTTVAILAIATSCLAQTTPIIQSVPGKPIKEPFLHNRFNRDLVAIDFTARTLDTISTRQMITSPCKCFYEKQEPQFIANSTPLQLATSLGIATGETFLAAKLWSHGHRRIARGILIADSAINLREGAINNWELISGAKSRKDLTSGHKVK